MPGCVGAASGCRAAAHVGDPLQSQPFRELGLTAAEYERIVALLGRRPTDAELGRFSLKSDQAGPSTAFVQTMSLSKR